MPSIICSATVYRLSDRLFFIQLRLTIKLIPQRLDIVPFFLLVVVGNLGSPRSWTFISVLFVAEINGRAIKFMTAVRRFWISRWSNDKKL